MEPEKEEKIIQKEKEEQHKKKEKLWKIIAVILSIFLIILVVVWASNSEEVRVGPLIGFIMFIVFLFVSLFWGISWYRRFQELQKNKLLDGKLPPAITIEQARELIKEQLASPNYADYCVGWKDHKLYNIGKGTKNRILLVHLDLTYSEKLFNFYIMNMHYPREMWSLITQDRYNVSELTRAINALSISPEDEPDTTVVEEENPMLGTRRRVIETHKIKQEEKKEEKKGDLQ